MYRYLAAAIAVFALGAWSAWTVQDWRFGAKEAERLQLVAEQAKKNERTADRAAIGHESDRSQIRKQFITINREAQRVVESPVYRSVCFDPSGLRILAAAIDGEPTTGEPARALPGPGQAR